MHVPYMHMATSRGRAHARLHTQCKSQSTIMLLFGTQNHFLKSVSNDSQNYILKVRYFSLYFHMEWDLWTFELISIWWSKLIQSNWLANFTDKIFLCANPAMKVCFLVAHTTLIVDLINLLNIARNWTLMWFDWRLCNVRIMIHRYIFMANQPHRPTQRIWLMWK